MEGTKTPKSPSDEAREIPDAFHPYTGMDEAEPINLYPAFETAVHACLKGKKATLRNLGRYHKLGETDTIYPRSHCGKV